jgi:peptidoglycan hydrolase-like protein with peptidoglycan-binding domain
VPSGDPVLRTGSSGQAVRQLQQCLNHADLTPNPGLEVDGEFGAKTEAAVARLQRSAGLVVDGQYGPKTAAKLRARVN